MNLQSPLQRPPANYFQDQFPFGAPAVRFAGVQNQRPRQQAQSAGYIANMARQNDASSAHIMQYIASPPHQAQPSQPSRHQRPHQGNAVNPPHIQFLHNVLDKKALIEYTPYYISLSPTDTLYYCVRDAASGAFYFFEHHQIQFMTGAMGDRRWFDANYNDYIEPHYHNLTREQR